MDKEYNFEWITEEIDNSLIFMLKSGKEILGSYHVQSLKFNGIDDVKVKFANINDLTNFINYTCVRFVNSQNSNVVDIPISKINDLYSKLVLEEGNPQPVALTDLNCFAVLDDKVVSEGYAIVPYKINECSDEFNKIMKLIANFSSLSMNNKIDVLEEINLINYHKVKEKQGLKR